MPLAPMDKTSHPDFFLKSTYSIINNANSMPFVEQIKLISIAQTGPDIYIS